MWIRTCHKAFCICNYLNVILDIMIYPGLSHMSGGATGAISNLMSESMCPGEIT